MRNNKKKELDVDFIGGEEPLTKEEEKAISDYIKSQKKKATKLHYAPKTVPKKRVATRRKSLT